MKIDYDQFVELSDQSLFGSETADTEDPVEVEKYFVSSPKFEKFLNPDAPFGVVRARKGVGKSALLKHATYSAELRGEISCFTTGSDLMSNGGLNGESANELIAEWKELLSEAVCNKIAYAIDTPKSAVEIAILRKVNPIGANRDTIRTVLSLISLKIPFVGMKGFEEISYQELLAQYLSESERKIWIGIDDIDATFRSIEREMLVVSQFFTAARLLSADISGLYIRCSVRKDVWTTLSRNDEALDKCEQDMTDINWSYSGTSSIIANRVKNYVEKNQKIGDVASQNGLKDKDYIDLVFEEVLPWGEGVTPNYRVIHRLSGGRPRWALQLCKACAASVSEARRGNKKTKFKSSKKITTGVISHVLPKYSRFRVGDIVKEHRHQCENIEDIILAFDGHSAIFNTEQILNFVQERVMKFYQVSIDNEVAEGCHEVCSFLFRIDFIEAVNKNNKSKHYRYEDYPHFFRSLSADHSYVEWQINPSFRAALHV